MADIGPYGRRTRDAILHGVDIGDRVRRLLRRPNPTNITRTLNLTYEQQRLDRDAVQALAEIIRDHDNHVQNEQRQRRWLWRLGIAGPVMLTLGLLTGYLSGCGSTETPKPNQPSVSEQRKADTENYHINALVDGKWYAEKEIPADKNPADYRIFVKGEALGQSEDVVVYVDPKALPKVKEAISKSEKNDAQYNRMPNFWQSYRPKDIAEIIQAMPGKRPEGAPDRIVEEDAQKTLDVIGAYGGKKEITGK